MSTSLRTDKSHLKLTTDANYSEERSEKQETAPSTIISVGDAEASSQQSLALPKAEQNVAPTQTAERGSRSAAGGDTGNYELGAVIHRDAQGVAYRARKPGCTNRLALKVFTSGISEPQAIENFQRAAETAFTWSHAGLAKVYDYGFSDSGKPFVVTEELQGRNLEDILAKEKKLSRERALRTFIQVCDALGYVSWTKNSVGDLCSQNIFITRDESGAEGAKVSNIGLYVETHCEVAGLPPSGARANYASPERCSGLPVDERSAIYSIGCLLYEAVSGSLPFKGKNEFEIVQKQLSAKPAPLFRKERKRDKRLEEVIFKCLEKNPENRFQTFNELSGELDSILNTLPQVAASKFLTGQAWFKMLACFADLAILAFAITVTTLSVSHMIAGHNSDLKDLKIAIARAEEASRAKISQSVPFHGAQNVSVPLQRKATESGYATVIHGTNIYTSHRAGDTLAPLLWQEAIEKATKMHQPEAVLADMHARKAESFDLERNAVDAEMEFKKALALYEKEGLTFEAQQVTSQLSLMSIQLVRREFGDPLYKHLTPDHIDRFRSSVEKHLKVRKEIGLDDTYGFNYAAHLAGMLVNQRHYAQAESLLKDSLSAVEPEAQSWEVKWQLADCLKREGKLAQSAIWYDRALHSGSSSPVDPDFQLISKSYQDVLIQLGRTKDAERIRLETAERLNPRAAESSGKVYYEPPETVPPYVPSGSGPYDAFSGD
ncbi:MAG: protein kinase [Candidatus Obscuribacterales bacterium]|nr:protein kinase [Candidatus Obscuribacterales bacterium]